MTIDQRVREAGMKFGEVNKTRVIDTEGSTATTQTVYVNGEVKTPQRVRYEFRDRVRDEIQEQEVYFQFSTELAKNPKMLDPAFKIERNKRALENGYYYAVRCWTTLEY